MIGYKEENIPSVCSPVTESEESESSPSNDDLWGSIPYVLTENNEPTTGALTLQTNTDKDVVTVYSQPNFGGSSIDLDPGYYNIQDLADLGISPESISGVKINTKGYIITLYSGDEPTSDDRIVDYITLRDTSDWNGPLRNMNNKTRSLKIEPDPNKNKLEVKLTGNSNHILRLPIGKYTETDLKSYGLTKDFKILSYEIKDGYQMRIYSEDFFVNETDILTGNGNASNLENILSLKIQEYTNYEDVEYGCTFYDKINYGGSSFRLSYGEYNMASLIQRGITYDTLDSTLLLKSAEVPKEYNVIFYSKDEFQGVPQKLKTSSQNIQGDMLLLFGIKSIKIVGSDVSDFSFKTFFRNLINMVMDYSTGSK